MFCSVGKMEAPPAPGNLLLCLSFNVHSVFELASWYFIFIFIFFYSRDFCLCIGSLRMCKLCFEQVTGRMSLRRCLFYFIFVTINLKAREMF